MNRGWPDDIEKTMKPFAQRINILDKKTTKRLLREYNLRHHHVGNDTLYNLFKTYPNLLENLFNNIDYKTLEKIKTSPKAFSDLGSEVYIFGHIPPSINSGVLEPFVIYMTHVGVVCYTIPYGGEMYAIYFPLSGNNHPMGIVNVKRAKGLKSYSWRKLNYAPLPHNQFINWIEQNPFEVK